MSPSDDLKDAPGATKSSPARLLVVVLMALAVGAVFVFGLDDYLSFEVLKSNRQSALEWYAQNRIVAVISFGLGYALAVALSVPGAVWLTLAAGFLFGISRGLPLETCAHLGHIAAAEVIAHFGPRPEQSYKTLAEQAGIYA